jgi:hypothetical protein
LRGLRLEEGEVAVTQALNKCPRAELDHLLRLQRLRRRRLGAIERLLRRGGTWRELTARICVTV